MASNRIRLSGLSGEATSNTKVGNMRMRGIRTTGLLLGCLSASAYAGNATPSDPLAEMQAQLTRQQVQIEQLQQKLEAVEADNQQLRQDHHQNWMTERRAEEVKTLIRDVLADSAQRAALIDDGLTAGYRNGFFLASTDGNSLLRIESQLQFRYIFNSSDNTTDENVGGFDIARYRQGLRGHIIDPSWKYYILWGFNPSGDSLLLDMWIEKNLGEGWAVRFGQLKTPFNREFIVSTKRQQFVERSIMAQSLSGRYTQGVTLSYQPEPLRFFVGVNDGLLGANTAWNADNVEALGVTGRAEWRVMGEWKQFKDFEAWPGEQPMLVIGAAGHFEQGEYGTTTDEARTVQWTIDASLEINGLSVYGAVIGRHIDDSNAAAMPEQDLVAALLQGGYFITDDIELIARYEWGDMDIAGVEDLSALTAGFNYFFDRHSLRWTTDVMYSFNAMNQVTLGGQTFGWPVAFQGWRGEPAGSEGQLVVRSQIQLLF
jgi:hypothetical protein